MSFGERMRARREELGLSRTLLARRLGVSASAIGNYETGISFPKEEVMLRLFDCLQTDPNYLFQDSFSTGGQVLSQSERTLLTQYRGLSPVGRGSRAGSGRSPGSFPCTAAPPPPATPRRCSGRILTMFR